MDGLLLATKIQEACQETTQSLLKTLQTLGYWVSAKKAQLCQPKVTYLGYIIKKGNRALAPSRMQAVLQIPTPTTKLEVREFLRAVGYCKLWVLGFAEIAKPLYACTEGIQPLTWTKTEQRAFDELKSALTTAPALALPNISKPFWLFVHEKQGVAKGALTQTLGPSSRPVAYVSKRLDPIASGWPTCLRAVAAMALLVKEADKLTLGQELNLVAPNAVESLLRGAPGKWMSNVHIVQYQALLLDQPRIKFLKTTVLNPATLLPDSELEKPVHDCQQTMDVLHAA
ncbi:uncharacterized protein LOC116543905 [Sapajus apella]|uniref:Uncharacterized protein LOC116543905 n=1 Tax=Sapajus apella TaxID=9515 RepID=A0A6J3H7F2_SAPAP|nr:uncharacterized protein LOC116543905 [Sapajus apella]